MLIQEAEIWNYAFLQNDVPAGRKEQCERNTAQSIASRRGGA